MKSRSFHLFALFALLLSLAGNLLTFTPVHAAGLVVNTSNDTIDRTPGNGICADSSVSRDCSLRAAMQEANALAGADTITFDADYTIITLAGSQLPAVTSDITIKGNGEANTIIQANANPNTASYRVFEVRSGGNLTLDGLTVSNGSCIDACASSTDSGGGVFNRGTLTITNSTFSGNSADYGGGGVFNSSNLTITNSTFSGNSADYGGGFFNDGTLTITDSTFSGNSATDFGGGVYNHKTLTITNSTFSENSATSLGGGVFNDGTLTITSNTFSDNFANSNAGGGIYNHGTLTITNSNFSSNTALYGGGIYNIRTLTITNSTFSGNSALYGGGISNGRGTLLTITNSTFSVNSASYGGGVFNQGMLTITNSTFSENSATSLGGGVYNDGTLNLANTILANSASGGDCFSSGSGTIGTTMNNLIESTGADACQLTNRTNGNIIGSDPNLGPLADNGGFTQTHALLSPSPAMDKGKDETCATPPVRNIDQRGSPRPACDIGAYEYGLEIPVVTPSESSLASASSVTLVFNQEMKSDGSAEAANNIVNYMLINPGSNSVFDTLSCKEGPGADDIPQTLSTASYNNALRSATITPARPLDSGTYRLFACGTTSIWSVAGIKLNNGLSDSTVDFTVLSAAKIASALPKTGFAPNKTTTLRPQPTLYEYASLGELRLEIPSLNVKSTIVGVPQNTDKTWDVTWLGSDVGWLNGTAFPTWNGNSVLTAHVTNASGMNGPFAALRSLKYGERVIVHMDGLQYIYEVRNSRLARPYSTSYAFQSMQDHAYLTLITCQGYNPITESYLFRRVVRAVLISVENE